jgi:hypothetical protein
MAKSTCFIDIANQAIHGPRCLIDCGLEGVGDGVRGERSLVVIALAC